MNTPDQIIVPHRLALVAKVTRNMILILGADGAVEWVNPAFEAHSGYRLEAIKGRMPSEFLAGPCTDQDSLTKIRRHLFCNTEFEMDLLQYNAQGQPYWVHTYGTPVGGPDGTAPGFVLIQSDISDRKNGERGLRIAASVFDRSHDAIIISDQKNRIVDVNPSFTRITGYAREEVLGLAPSILSSGRHSLAFYRTMWQSIEETDHWRGEIWNRRKNGEEFAELLSISRVHLDSPANYYHVATFSDITALKNHAKELDRAANYDPLTGLPNRQWIEERLRAAKLTADRNNNPLFVCYLDIDGFKLINDQLGTDVGDEALRIIGERLNNRLEEDAVIARIGGDEFVLLLEGEQSEADYRRILSVVSDPITLQDTPIMVTASLGITRYPEDNTDAEGLIRHADHAMYSAKEKGRNQYQVFDPGQHAWQRERRFQLIEIAQAIENDEFELHFQPQLRMADSEIIGFEALIRWHHPEKGLIAPGLFLPAVEHSHLESALGQWVINHALAKMQQWQEAGQEIPVCINISAAHMMDPAFVDVLSDCLLAHPSVNPGQVTLEVLESTALEDTKSAANMLARCRKLGVQVALDDFGTGFSSMTYLRSLPVDMIKIDQSFIRNMLSDANDRAIVEGIIFMAQRFRHRVLAEGVETLEHAMALKKMGCDLIQGYGIARPMPAADVLSWLENWQSHARHKSIIHELRSANGQGEGI
ncbi:EAL domain-containing protein [Marinobacter daepoensis]|uniref:sensor domain-containing protein n=1 Tax=Marinobacter daepoensis TaxID=262077 RepID=UPI001C985671|nr:EAL domain-containing protein [Marinobacter daepoensis]MBY6032811.1 EAL domain-containing protein [Marinobacter daepoensis]